MPLASVPSVSEVAAFIGPLLIAIGLLGTLVGWIIKRSADRMQGEFRHFSELNDERMRALEKQLETQAATLMAQNKQLLETSITVARIEGRVSPPLNPGQH